MAKTRLKDQCERNFVWGIIPQVSGKLTGQRKGIRFWGLIIFAALILGFGVWGMVIAGREISGIMRAMNQLRHGSLVPQSELVSMPVERLRMVVKSKSPQEDDRSLSEMLRQFPETEGLRIGEWIFVEVPQREDSKYDAGPLVAAFERRFGKPELEVIRDHQLISKALEIHFKMEASDAALLERIRQEMELMVVLTHKLWLKTPWDPRADSSPAAIFQRLERRKWVAEAMRRLPKSQQTWVQGYYSEPYQVDPKVQIPAELKKLFPPPCKVNAREALENRHCLAGWHLQVGSFLDQLPISKNQKDPEDGVFMPEVSDLKYFGFVYWSNKTSTSLEGTLGFARTAPALGALVAYLNKRGLKSEVSFSWHKNIRK